MYIDGLTVDIDKILIGIRIFCYFCINTGLLSLVLIVWEQASIFLSTFSVFWVTQVCWSLLLLYVVPWPLCRFCDSDWPQYRWWSYWINWFCYNLSLTVIQYAFSHIVSFHFKNGSTILKSFLNVLSFIQKELS